MVERPAENLSVRRQCELLNVARSGVYRPKKAPSAEDLALMRRIDELHLELPFYGSRRMTFELNREGRAVNRKRVRRLMRVMGIEALAPRPGTSKAAPGHKIYPYLLRGLAITEPNHVWACDITYIPMANGFLYLVAIMDWASRAVLSWRLSNTMDTRFCVEALEEALQRHGKPRIFNTDQGAQFTSAAFTGKLEAAGVAISMDGRGRFLDNIFIERLWRSIKYEEVHLKAYADGREARAGIGSWMNFYNHRRPHQAMDNQTPMAVWREGMKHADAPAEAVDMPLRLDNANALPTYPQQRQKKQKKAA
jgi:putative transposase